jgi:hypothetical protein
MTRARDLADTQDNLGGAVAPFVAGKNKIINGDFGVWQRGTTFTNPVAGTFTADRWSVQGGNTPSASSITQQTFTPGTAPVAGYEGTFFWRNTMTTNTGTDWYALQKVEDVRTYAGNTTTLSFWAKADSARTMGISALQYFGTGGSASVAVSGATVNLTTAWQRFSVTLIMPSVAGKTIGVGSFINLVFAFPTANGSVTDLWGGQWEIGTVATPFTTASGSIGGELALCQRYYETGAWVSNNNLGSQGYPTIYYKATKRATPTITNTGSLTAGATDNASGWYQASNDSGNLIRSWTASAEL